MGVTTVVCVGVGDAIGSGVFRTPGDIASLVSSPWIILAFWLAAGVITLCQSLVMAELATRFPKAGGEYQYLKEAYGDFAGFIFGWSFGVFIIGCGAGTIAAALGDFASDLFSQPASWASPAFGCAGIILVIAVNAAGLSAGAITQNVLTVLKIAVLFVIAGGALALSGNLQPIPTPAAPVFKESIGSAFIPALLYAFWPFTGATDSAKLAEEVHDVHRALPRALIRTVFVLTVVYLFYNFALLCAMSPAEMADKSSPHALIFQKLNSPFIQKLILVGSILICLGSLASMFLANIRVVFAMARDGLAFSFLGRMSKNQAPIAALLSCGAIACLFVLNRNFEQILRIYFLGSALLFAMTYLSLLVFRNRENASGLAAPSVYRVPGGILLALFLVLVEIVIAVGIIYDDAKTWVDGTGKNNQYDSIYSTALFIVLTIAFFVWKKTSRLTGVHSSGRE